MKKTKLLLEKLEIDSEQQSEQILVLQRKEVTLTSTLLKVAPESRIALIPMNTFCFDLLGRANY